ncbi:hypothetical protein V5O48_000622 [Marasmius crinis-equi]|uniref:IucC family-domain-containing protein n=1 Tax=Marasmius crinis-equi TaxID=585013 RepID=A0ABR3G172_9AGAR
MPSSNLLSAPSSARYLEPAARAAYATSARMLSCLVTESLVRALYFPIEGFEATGICVILSGSVSSRQPLPLEESYELRDILAVLPLQHIPIFKYDRSDPRGREIGLLDPMDMLPLVLRVVDDVDTSEHLDLSKAFLTLLSGPGWSLPSSARLAPSKGPLALWYTFAEGYGVQDSMVKEIAEEFESSVLWAEYSFRYPPKAPLFSSSSIEWEQSIVEGHPTHPMHKTRMFLPPMTNVAPGSYDLYHAKLRFVSLPATSLKVTYDFVGLTKPLLDAACEAAGEKLCVPAGHIVVPVHELQVAHIQDKFKEAIIYPSSFSIPFLAQQSVRSVILPSVYQRLHLKLGVGIKLTSAVRTISPASAYLGPRFSAQVVPAITMDPKLLTVAKELASVVHAHPESDVARHCAAIVRETFDLDSEERGERLIVCTALVESGHEGPEGHLPAVIRVFGLHSEEKRVAWLEEFVSVFFKAFLPSVIYNGVAFEAHPQNCIARFDLISKKILGFIIRDFGGIRVQPETLFATTGVRLDAVEGHSIIAPDLDDVYARMYHTVFHNHLQQLIRVLGLHYNGLGWEIVRKHLKENIPHDHSLYKAWLSPERKTFPGKCFMRMRMQGMYRFHLHGPFPNLLLYKGVAAK